MDIEAVVIFTDIRGFTRWAENTEVFANLDEFGEQFIALVHRWFPAPTLIKPLGDGAMIVLEDTGKNRKALLAKQLKTIQAANTQFKKFCTKFSHEMGHPAQLELGWSIVRGKVKPMKDDFIGPNVNKAARLCDMARPFGIVIDKNDFPELPPTDYRFFAQTRALSGMDNAAVRVTEEIQNQFLPRELLRQEPEVHVAGVCIKTEDSAPQILVARRAANRKLFPGLLEGCGGQLAHSESFEQGVQRHFQKELDLKVQVLSDIHCFYRISEPNEPFIPGIRFLCKAKEIPPVLTSPRHSEVRWVSEAEFKKIRDEEFVPGLKKEALALIQQWKKSTRPSSKK